jgi:archaellum component FlaF (FlaF/FlaG flagellin family)
MINLLPNDKKSDIIYARKNTLLLRWSLLLVVATIIVVVLIGAGNLYIKASEKSYNKQIADTTQTLQSENLTETQKKITDLSNNVTLIQKVLENTILFSKLLKQAGAVMPPGTVLSNLEISKVEGGIDLTAQAKDYKSATQIQVNLADPDNKVFEKVDILSINCSETSDNGYPCSVNLRALFGDNSPYLFITKASKSEAKP